MTHAAEVSSPDVEPTPTAGWFSDRRTLFAIVGIAAAVCTLALAILSVQSYHFAVNQDGATAGELFGFPSAFIGLATAPVALTIAVAGFTGVRFPRWFLMTAQVGFVIGLGYALWLAYQASTVAIGLGPWHVTNALFTAVAFLAFTRLSTLPAPEPVEEDEGEATGWRHNRRVLFAVMGISAIVCTVASAVLSAEAYHLALNPQAPLACDLSAVLSCSEVAKSKQAQFFGFPNAFIGLATEPVVLTIAVAGMARVRFPRWFMFAAQIGYTLGLIFAYWLFYQSYVNIGALCPWCLTVTVFTTVTFFTMLHINIQDRNLYLRPRAQAAMDKFLRLDLDLILPAVMIVGIGLAIILKYGTLLF